MASVSILWPVDERGEGFVVGWRTPGNVVVCGVIAFSFHSEALEALSSFREQLSKSGFDTHFVNSLGLLGRCTQEEYSQSPCFPNVKWEEQMERISIILYRRSSPNSMRLYCLDMINLDILLAIQPLGPSTDLRERRAANMTAQLTALPEHTTLHNVGIDSVVLEKINSASSVIESLKGSWVNALDLKQDRKWLMPERHTAPFVRPLRRSLANIGTQFQSLLSLWSFLDMSSAAVHQLDLRYEQVRFVLEQLHIYNNRLGARDIEVSARYVSAQNCIWLILNDIIIGAAVGSFLFENRNSLGHFIYNQSKYITVDLLRQGIHWLDNWPAGLKLNTELSRFLFYFLTGVLGIWEVIIDGIAPYMSTTIAVVGLLGPMGMTMILSFSSDIIRCLTIHLNIAYSMIRIAYKSQLTMANSLFNLFRGKRYNILRQRLDDWDYDLDQLLLGAMLFTLISFLFPTITIYYILFALNRLSYITLHACIEVILALLNHFPLFALTLRIKDPWRLPGGIHFIPLTSTPTNVPCLVMKNSPLPLSRIFSQYAVLGSRLLSFYSPIRLFVVLSKGDPLTRIPRRFIRYSYGRVAKAS